MLLLLVTCGLVVGHDDLLVKIGNGDVRGTYMDSRNGWRFRAFLGIPYAKAPVAELRFEPPVPVDDWSLVWDATKTHEPCIQTDTFRNAVIGSEDCLYLNVYTPLLHPAKQLSVMVFIHGGGFTSGSGSIQHYEPDYFMDKDILLVTINYRLGPLGFLKTGDEVVPGNLGLKDQVFALNWIRQNIGYFGGDAESVTVFGESAGGSSAHYLTLSPLSKGLVHAAISQSGVATCHWSIQTRNEGVELAQKLARIFECPIGSSQEMVDCLRRVPAAKIIEEVKQFQVWNGNPIILFKPVVEGYEKGSFLPDHPLKLIENGEVLQVPWMVGMNSEEGALIATMLALSPDLLKTLDEDFEDKFPHTCSVHPDILKNVASDMKNFYAKNGLDHSAITDLCTDTMFLSCIEQSVTAHRKFLSQKIYHYLFDYRGNVSLIDLFGTHQNTGVSHGDELFYLFPLRIVGANPLNEEDFKMSEQLLTLWTNFAKYRTPTLNWKPVTSESNEYLHIMGPRMMEMKTEMMKERVEFWRALKVHEGSYHFYRDEL